MTRDEAGKKADFLNARQKFQAEHRAKGLCLDCHNVPSEGRTRCDACMENRKLSERKRRVKAKEKGMCTHCCTRPHLQGNSFCQQCYLQAVSVKHFKTARCWVELETKWDGQGGKCALSGLSLTLGTNAELDHIIPLAKKGCEDVSNVQWVFRAVNRMKRDMVEAEFLSLVKQIYQHSISRG